MDSTDRKYTVYMHTAPNGKKYIGITCQKAARRWASGGKGYKSCPLFWSAIRKYGWDNVVHQVIAEGLTEEEAKLSEMELIRVYNTRNPLYGYNLTDGGDGTSGFHHSYASKKRMSAAHKGYVATAETRAKLSEIGKGRVPSDQARANMTAAQTGNQKWLGRKHAEEARMKISEAQKGRVFSEKTREKMSASAIGKTISLETRRKLSASLIGNQRTLGYKHTAETRAKMSAAHIGKQTSLGIKLTEETKQKMRDAHRLRVRDVECLTVEGDFIERYSSIREAYEKTNIHHQNIWSVCAGKTKTAGGYKWRYA